VPPPTVPEIVPPPEDVPPPGVVLVLPPPDKVPVTSDAYACEEQEIIRARSKNNDSVFWYFIYFILF
jgi:hypothetical protein